MMNGLLKPAIAIIGYLSTLTAFATSDAVIPSGFSVTEPAPGSTVKEIKTISFKSTSYTYLTLNQDVKIQINGNDVESTALLSGSAKSIVTYTLATPITEAGEYEITIPEGAVSYTYFGDANQSGLFKFSVTISGGNDDPTPETPVIPDNFTVSPEAGSEVESISELIIESILYEGMEVYEGKTILIDGNSVDITSKKLDNWGSKLGITLTNPVTTNGVHTITIPAGTFKYSKMFGGESDNTEFKYTLIVANNNPIDPEKPTIITEQPTGELKTFDRSGNYYYAYEGYLRTGAQTGTVDIVFADDRRVYIKDPVNNLALGSWVEGSLNEEGNTITVKLGQYLYEDAEHGYVTLQMVEYNDDEEWFDPISAEEVTYTVNGDVISLNGTYRKGKCLGVVWETANEWAGNADYDTKYSPVLDIDPVVVPDDITLNTYKFKGLGYGGSELEYTVNVGFVENDMYVQGIFTDTPQAWIKGQVEGNTITFKSPQYLGKAAFDKTKDLFMVATALSNTYDIVDLKLTYDEEKEEYVNTDQYLILNTSKNTVYMLEAISNFSLNKISNDGVYTVPYSNTFGSNASINDYTIIDANEDGNGWYFSSDRMAYNYCPNKADDWLITPAITLEAGKTYKFTLKARSFASMYPERFEVKMGEAATVEAMTTDVIASTEVASDTFAPFSGDVTIQNSGNYHFGIHAISDPDEFTLYIDDISVEEGSGVSNINIESEVNDGNIYSIDGRIIRTEGELTPGIYIKNGKKIIVR